MKQRERHRKAREQQTKRQRTKEEQKPCCCTSCVKHYGPHGSYPVWHKTRLEHETLYGLPGSQNHNFEPDGEFKEDGEDQPEVYCSVHRFRSYFFLFSNFILKMTT